MLKPSAGEIVVLGKPVLNGDFRSDVGLVFQNPDDQLFCHRYGMAFFRPALRLIRLLRASEETNLIASHDIELVLEVCERVVLIGDGRIIADGKPREVMGDDKLMEARSQERPYSLVQH